MIRAIVLILAVTLIKPVSYELKQTTNQKASTALKTGWYYVLDKENSYSKQLYKSNEKYFIDPHPIVLAKHFAKVEIESSNYNGKPNQYLLIKFDQIGTDAWSKATEKALNKKLALVIDGKLIIAPTVNSKITAGVSALNRGDLSEEELEKFKKILRSEM